MLPKKIVGEDSPGLKKKLAEKKRWLIIIVIVVTVGLVGGVAYYIVSNDSSEKSELETAFEQTKSAELPPSAIDPSKPVEINKLILEKKFARAKTEIDKIKSNPSMTEGDMLIVYAQLASVCSELKDVKCLGEVFEFQKSKNNLDLFLLIDAARIAEGQGDISQSNAWFQEAKKIVDEKGGKNYIDKLNEKSQISLDYAEITEGAKK